MPSTKFDDRDPSVKLSNTGWLKLLDHDLFDGTVSHTRLPGASFNIKFTGVSISIFGEVIAKTTHFSTYAIDDANGTRTLFSPAVNPETQFNQTFFQSSELPLGDHTLFVKNDGDWFFFDYFIVETPGSSPTSQPPPNPPPPNPPTTNPPPQTNPPSTNPPQTDPPPTNSPQTTTQSPQETTADQTKLQSTNPQITQSIPPLITTIITDGQTSSQNPSPSGLVASPTDTSSVSSISRLSTAAIAGVAVGAVIATVTALVLIYCFYCKRRNAGNESRSEAQPTLIPFDGRQAVHPQPRSRSRKNGIHSIEYVIPIETRQPQASGSGSSATFREREHPEVNDSRQFEEQQSSTVWSGTYGYNPPPAYDQLSSLPVAL